MKAGVLGGFLSFFSSIGGDVPFSGAKVYRSVAAGNQAIPGGAFTPVEFDTELFDTDNYWDAGAPSVFTIPADGIYLAEANLLANDAFDLYLLINGDSANRQNGLQQLAVGVALGALSSVLQLTAGDEVQACEFSGPLSVTPAALMVNFSIVRLT